MENRDIIVDEKEDIKHFKTSDVVDLHHHFDENLEDIQQVLEIRLQDIRLYYDAKFEDLEKSSLLVSASLEKRLDSMNEFRNALTDQANHFITRAEYAINHDRVVDDIKGLRESRAELQGKASQSAVNIATVIAIIGVLIAVAGFIIEYMSR